MLQQLAGRGVVLIEALIADALAGGLRVFFLIYRETLDVFCVSTPPALNPLDRHQAALHSASRGVIAQ